MIAALLIYLILVVLYGLGAFGDGDRREAGTLAEGATAGASPTTAEASDNPFPLDGYRQQ